MRGRTMAWLTAAMMIAGTPPMWAGQQFFPDYTPGYDESRIGKVTCFTCHQGELQPKTASQ